MTKYREKLLLTSLPTLLCLTALLAPLLAAENKQIQDTKNNQEGYIFGWPDVPKNSMRPRGGVTKGVPVEVSSAPSLRWQNLKSSSFKGHKLDKLAIITMEGGYKVSFDFMETVIVSEKKPARPYRSWGTERVYILEERENFVSLQHVLVMFFKQGEKTVGPMVIKHWRQDWEYEPKDILEYYGDRVWKKRTLTEAQRKGIWSQTVYQVDDTPRYSLIGAWKHNKNISSWSSSQSTYRPLPRREFSVRNDYNVLDGHHKIHVLATGWVHEQSNTKTFLNNEQPETSASIIANEYGIIRYKRIVNFDFTAGDNYVEKTASYWKAVRDQWTTLIKFNEALKIGKKCDEQHAFELFFKGAEIAGKDGYKTKAEQTTYIKNTINCITTAL